MKITRTNLKDFRNDFKTALADLEKTYGVNIDLGNIKFTDNSFHSKMSVINVGGAVGEDVEKLKFENDCKRYGFKGTDFNKTLISNGTSFKLIGLKPANTKYPCIVENYKGKYKMSVRAVKRSLL